MRGIEAIQKISKDTDLNITNIPAEINKIQNSRVNVLRDLIRFSLKAPTSCEMLISTIANAVIRTIILNNDSGVSASLKKRL